MVTAVLIGTFILLWKISMFVIRVFLKVVCYLLAFIIAFVLYAVSFLFNVFTVPLLIVVHVAQKRRGKQLPYVGRRLLIFYPTFDDPKVTEANREETREGDQPVKVLVVHSDHWLDNPLFWLY